MTTIRSQNEIMKNWHDHSSPLISICCVTYNHEDYIQKTLNGLLNQETDYSFEILIYDDASSDNTQDIIESYQKKYPDIIKPTLALENQYSKGVRPKTKFNWPRAKGEFIALCEGDDMWTSCKKLQFQITQMLEAPEVNLSFHPVIKKDYLSDQEVIVGQCSKTHKMYDLDWVLRTSGANIFTPSIVFRKTILKEIPINFFETAPVVDHYLKIFGALNSNILFLPEPMGLYRKNLPGSWSNRIKAKRERLKYLDLHYKSLLALNEIIPNRYERSLKKNFSRTLLKFSHNELFTSAERLIGFLKYRHLGLLISNIFSVLLSLVPSKVISLLKKAKSIK